MIINAIVLLFVAVVSVFNVLALREQYHRNAVDFGLFNAILVAVGILMLIWTATSGMLLLAIAWIIMLAVDVIHILFWYNQED